MPFLSEDGTQNVFVLNVNRFYGLNKKLKQNPQKLEDALKVMRVLSTVAGTSALQPATALKSSLLPFKGAKADGTYYADVADALNAGNTAPFIYSGWENTIVTTGLKMPGIHVLSETSARSLPVACAKQRPTSMAQSCCESSSVTVVITSGVLFTTLS